MNNEAKQKLLNAKTDLDTDMQLDVTEAEDLMEEFFREFDVDRGNFNINTYYPDDPFSWNPFKKSPVVMVPDFTIGMLIESAKAGKWEGSIELRGLQHNLSLPTDSATGKVTGTRQHSPFQFTKELDSSSPYLFKAAATGQTLKTAEFRFYHINYSGQEEEYYRITLENVKVISVSPVMYDTRGCLD
ncbi:hypothetical protein L1887_42813 [Cichorium endivia]|nr:hypothetical protein L1887_42813 [Cichorium endivia]